MKKKESENRFLSQRNEIQSLQLKQHQYLIIGLGIAILMIIVIAWLFIRQYQFRSLQQSMYLEQKLLRSQMNPHFIFNSLQAIQNFVLNHDGHGAARYLSSFAFITRTVLESSRMDRIPLAKEIALLENYLQLQKLRFGGGLEFTIRHFDLPDPETITVPSMLSQPFIENAIEHGLRGIDEGGKIEVCYSKANGFLVIEIIDNGWGMRYENPPGKKHQSMALEITRERIALMNKKSAKKATLQITDAFAGDEKRKGVKVVISLPLNLQEA